MVEAATIRMRLHTWEEHGSMLGSDVNLPNMVSAGEPVVLDLYMETRPADAAGFSEIDPVTGHQLEDPGVAVELLSSDNKDNAAVGGAVQGIYIIGIDENNNMVCKPEPMHATTGTTVMTTTSLWKECFHTFAGLHGTEDMDAEGNITLRDIANNAICIIAATKNESDGSAIKIPDGHCGMLFHAHIKRLEPAAAVYASDEGVRLRIVYINPLDGEAGMAAADRCLNYINLEAVGAYIHDELHRGGDIFEEGTWIHFQHSSKVNAGELFSSHLKFLIWKK